MMDAGWWLSLPLWKMMEFVSWDDEIPNWMEKNHVPNHQPDMIDA